MIDDPSKKNLLDPSMMARMHKPEAPVAIKMNPNEIT